MNVAGWVQFQERGQQPKRLCQHGLSLAAVVLGAAAALAGPDVDQVLALKPIQPGVNFDTPSAPERPSCKLELLNNPSGWEVRDQRGLVVRRFVDTNSDNVIDRWSYYLNGQEVYRDLDTNGNGKADQFRYYYTGGSRWGIDANEDGRVDGWKILGAAEASGEFIAALLGRDTARLQLLMLTPAEAQALGIGEVKLNALNQSVQQAITGFPEYAARFPQDLTWHNFDGHQMMAIPGVDLGGPNDIILYANATIIAQTSSQAVYFRIPEIVRVGEVWKMSGLPTLIDPGKAISGDGVLLDMPEVQPQGATLAEASNAEIPPEAMEFVTALQTVDASVPTDGNPAALVSYHVKRAQLCAQIGQKCKTAESRETWYKQTADSLNAAVQTGEYTKGVSTLDEYANQFSKTSWGANLSAYFKFRAINAAYALQLTKTEEHETAQKQFIEHLAAFVQAYPTAEDLPAAMWQLGNALEFANQLEDASTYYKRLMTAYPESISGKRAAGAVRRLAGKGQAFRLTGKSLNYSGDADTAAYRGKVVVISYWATWCDPCKENMPGLKALRDKYQQQGLELVGVSLDSDRQAALQYVSEKGFNWPHICEEGGMESPPALAYGVVSLPYLIVLAPDGTVLESGLQFSELERAVEKALTQKIAAR